MGIRKHIRNIMRDTILIGKFSIWAKWSTKYDVGGHHVCQEICRRHWEHYGQNYFNIFSNHEEH
jgi:hypothetical protein